jgi:hypothetical protein
MGTSMEATMGMITRMVMILAIILAVMAITTPRRSKL